MQDTCTCFVIVILYLGRLQQKPWHQNLLEYQQLLAWASFSGLSYQMLTQTLPCQEDELLQTVKIKSQ